MLVPFVMSQRVLLMDFLLSFSALLALTLLQPMLKRPTEKVKLILITGMQITTT